MTSRTAEPAELTLNSQTIDWPSGAFFSQVPSSALTESSRRWRCCGSCGAPCGVSCVAAQAPRNRTEASRDAVRFMVLLLGAHHAKCGRRGAQARVLVAPHPGT